MNKLRVFRNIFTKRRKPYRYGCLLLFFLFFPCIVTEIFGNGEKKTEETKRLMLREQLAEGSYIVINETKAGRETIPIEIYVADKLMRTMEEEYEEEALKAQALLLRAELIPEEGMSIIISDRDYGKKEPDETYLMAVMQTKGIYPEYNGKPIYGAYCRVTNGSTRTAEEVLKTTEYPYLKAVPCEKEFLSPDYSTTLVFEKKEWEEIFEKAAGRELPETVNIQSENEEQEEKVKETEIIRDSAGYVLFVRHLEKWVSGEEIRYALALPSAAFRIEEEGEKVYFHCRGAGHGMGLSQFGANEMAKEGKNYMEILEYYFEGITFTKI